jgi:hypothetical protein
MVFALHCFFRGGGGGVCLDRNAYCLFLHSPQACTSTFEIRLLEPGVVGIRPLLYCNNCSDSTAYVIAKHRRDGLGKYFELRKIGRQVIHAVGAPTQEIDDMRVLPSQPLPPDL